MVEELTVAVRSARYLAEVAEQSGSIIRLRQNRRSLPEHTVRLLLDRYLDWINQLFTSEEVSGSRADETGALYQKLKAALLHAIVNGQLDEDRGQLMLDDLSALRRLLDQGLKAKAAIRRPDVKQTMLSAED